MPIGDRIRQLREERGLSQGDIERATGMLRAYISRVEHGHTVPSLESIERFAVALDVPLHEMFRYGTEEGTIVSVEDPFLKLLSGYTRVMNAADRRILLYVAERLARPKSSH